MRIAIHPDRVVQKNGHVQSFSDRWRTLAEQAGIDVRPVNVYAQDLFDQLAGCDAFMWRFAFHALPRLFAKRLLPAIEHGMGILVFPSWRTCWHFEDKVAQHYLLRAAAIPMPRTWVLWRRKEALAFCRDATYPLVLKLASGFQSGNVRLAHTADEAAYWVDQLFGPGLITFDPPPPRSPMRATVRRIRAAATLLREGPRRIDYRRELQHGYFYAQEFLPGNEFDTRVTVIGDRAFAYRRLNRPNDFRASGSGRPVWDPAQIDLGFVRLAFRIARRLGTQSVAIDGLFRGREHVVGEVSYTYVSWMVRECPGHWVLRGEPDTGELEWVEGQLAPEDAIFDDFVAQLRARSGRTAPTPPPWPSPAG